MQDARFQQLHEQYQGAVLGAAREVDDAAAGFVANRDQVPLLEDSVAAARRSLDIATIQYREGLAGFERVLDSQRALFSQQERLVSALGSVTQSAITLYKAGRRLAGGPRAAADRRGDARDDGRTQRLGRTARRAATDARRRTGAIQFAKGRTMSQGSKQEANPETATPAASTAAAPPPGRATRAGAATLLALIAGA